MTLDHEPAPELQVARTGGRSARVIAVAVAAVLVGVVYIGLSGRDGSTKPRPSLVAAPTPGPTQRVMAHVDRIQAVRADPGAPVLYQYLGASLALGGQASIAILDPVREDEYRVSYRIPYSLVTSSANLNISTVMGTVSHDDFEVLGSWTFPLTVINDSSPQIAVLAARQPPEARMLSSPTFTRISRNGFRVSAIWDRRGDAGVLSIAVLVDPDRLPPSSPPPRTFPSEDYAVVVKTRAKTYASDAQETFAPGEVRGLIVLPASLQKRHVALELSAIPMADPLLGRIVVASHRMLVPGRSDYGTFATFPEAGGAPNPGLPEISTTGYSLRVRFVLEADTVVVYWQLLINPRELVPEAVAHRWVTGEDGLIGWPSALRSKPSATR